MPKTPNSGSRAKSRKPAQRVSRKRQAHAAAAARARALPQKAKSGGRPSPRKETAAARASRVDAILNGLDRLYPDADCELRWRNPLELLVATILSAQCTDVRVNLVTPALFARFPDAAALAAAPTEELEGLIHSTGFYRNKAKNIQGACRLVVERFDGEVPRTMDELLELPGVARKTANVVLGTAFGIADGVVVDTHIQRLSRRLGLTAEEAPEKIERDLMAQIPRERWIKLGHQLIWHGRRVCDARKPDCDGCRLAPHCPSAFATA